MVERTEVGGAPALLLAADPEPEGGLVHGGHLALVWNASGAAYAVSAHFREPVPADGRPGPAAVAALRAAAEAMRPMDR